MPDECTPCEWKILGPKIEERIERLEAIVDERITRIEVVIAELAKEMRACRESDRHHVDDRCGQIENKIQVLSNEIAKTRVNGMRTHEQLAVDAANTRARVAGLYALAGAGGAIIGGIATALGARVLGG